ncbi:MAG TPA: VWA domain-containing protein [Terriglobales bacterium]|jgi:VWFA-related protein|nr:VWA domain-containing protein [Terriglobales bacterium]
MFSSRFASLVQALRSVVPYGLWAVFLLGTVAASGLWTRAQDQSGPSNGQQTQAPPESGGPQGDVGPYAIPKKKEEPPPPPPTKPKKIEGMGDYSIQVSVPLVDVPVSITTKDGQFISSLKKENFKIYEDGVQQTISNFSISDAPITAVLLVEFANLGYVGSGITLQTLQASYSFAQSLKKDDWVAVTSYDIKPQILVDFTQDKGAVFGALNTLRVPGFSETNLFDALYDTLDRIDRVEGHKYIILISSGFDSFSKLNLDQILKKVKATKDVTIFAVSTGWTIREACEVQADQHRGNCGSRGMAIPAGTMDYLQADNEMKTFARMTGGRFYQPRFQGEYAGMFHDIAGDIRNQYSIAYRPTNPKLDGSYRKLKVEVMAPDGGPLKVHDQKGKDVKYEINAREGYTAKHVVD